MKKYSFTFFILIITLTFSLAQENTSMLGLVTSYNRYQNLTNWIENPIKKGFSIGLEYSESKGRWGYRAGIVHTRIKDQTIYDFDDGFYLDLLIDIWILPEPSPLDIIDFPISGQYYLPLGQSKFKLYANLGLMTSLSFYEQKDTYRWFGLEDQSKSLSFRGTYGGGFSYQFAQHFNIDLSANQIRRLHTFDDSHMKPKNSLSFSTRLNYIF